MRSTGAVDLGQLAVEHVLAHLARGLRTAWRWARVCASRTTSSSTKPGIGLRLRVAQLRHQRGRLFARLRHEAEIRPVPDERAAVHEDEPGHAIGMLPRVQHRDPRAQGVADDDGRVLGALLHHRLEAASTWPTESGPSAGALLPWPARSGITSAVSRRERLRRCSTRCRPSRRRRAAARASGRRRRSRRSELRSNRARRTAVSPAPARARVFMTRIDRERDASRRTRSRRPGRPEAGRRRRCRVALRGSWAPPAAPLDELGAAGLFYTSLKTYQTFGMLFVAPATRSA